MDAEAGVKRGHRAERIRVVHLIQNFLVGGLERMVFSLAEGAKAHGVISTVVGYLTDGDYRAAFDRAGIETVHFFGPERLNLTVPWQLYRYLLTNKVDIIHTHHVGPFIYGLLPAKIHRLGHVHTEHSRELYDNRRRKLVGRAMDYLSLVVSVSEEVAQYRKDHFGRYPEVIPNGVEIPPQLDADARRDSRASLGIDESAFVVGCIARLSPEKDISALIRGFAEFSQQRENALLVVVGDGEHRDDLSSFIKTRGLTDKVRLLGLRSDVERLLMGFDVIALTSRREGLPLSLLEGMARGLPVVATRVGGIPELLSEGGGLTVHPGDDMELAGALQKMASDSEFRRQEGQKARQIVAERYSREKMVERYVEIYQSLRHRTSSR